LIAAAAIAADAYLTPLIVNRVTAATRAGISPCARAAAREIAAQPWAGREGGSASEADAWSRLAESLALGTDARVTIVRRDGEILGQSPAADPARADGVTLEPDIRDALRTGEGWTVTPSLTGGPRILDVAVAWEGSAGRSGAVRFAVPLTEATFARIELRRAIWCGAAIALLAALALSSVVASRVSGVASELTRAARRMSEGDLTVRTRLPGHDELAELGQALDRLAGGLATTLGELRAERDLQKRILEAMHEGVVVVDGDGRIALVNPAIRSMLLLGADAVGKLLIETMRHAQLHTMLERARAAPDDRLVEIELPGLKPRRMLVQVAPLAGAEGLLFVFVDVTELRRLESLRRDFVANASHELRTPIAAVRSATETLRTGALEDRVAATRFVDIIERNAVRLQYLVEDMLELSKLESNEFKLKREPVELQRVVPIVLALFRERAEKKGVRLGSDLPPTLPAVEGDARALEHVLSNLVDNAVKYCPAGSKISVGASDDDSRVRLVVADTGPGIAPEHVPRVFERFYRVDAGRSRELGGTGLGLSIVKHMVEAMRGKVSVESQVGRGSIFTVSLNRADVSALRDSSAIKLG
jgi:two-component system phosphate regulon sensor histidine kinase PhoR